MLRRVPRVGSPTSLLLLRHSDFPAPQLARSRLLVGSVSPRSDGISQVPRRPTPHMPRSSIPAESSKLASGAKPLRSLRRSCLPCLPTRRPPQLPHFGIQFRSLRARCLRFVTTVARCFFTITQDSLPAGGPTLAGRESNPLGRTPGFVMCLASHDFLLDEACLAHGKGGDRGHEAASSQRLRAEQNETNAPA